MGCRTSRPRPDLYAEKVSLEGGADRDFGAVRGSASAARSSRQPLVRRRPDLSPSYPSGCGQWRWLVTFVKRVKMCASALLPQQLEDDGDGHRASLRRSMRRTPTGATPMTSKVPKPQAANAVVNSQIRVN